MLFNKFADTLKPSTVESRVKFWWRKLTSVPWLVQPSLSLPFLQLSTSQLILNTHFRLSGSLLFSWDSLNYPQAIKLALFFLSTSSVSMVQLSYRSNSIYFLEWETTQRVEWKSRGNNKTIIISFHLHLTIHHHISNNSAQNSFTKIASLSSFSPSFQECHCLSVCNSPSLLSLLHQIPAQKLWTWFFLYHLQECHYLSLSGAHHPSSHLQQYCAKFIDKNCILSTISYMHQTLPPPPIIIISIKSAVHLNLGWNLLNPFEIRKLSLFYFSKWRSSLQKRYPQAKIIGLGIFSKTSHYFGILLTSFGLFDSSFFQKEFFFFFFQVQWSPPQAVPNK